MDAQQIANVSKALVPDAPPQTPFGPALTFKLLRSQLYRDLSAEIRPALAIGVVVLWAGFVAQVMLRVARELLLGGHCCVIREVKVRVSMLYYQVSSNREGSQGRRDAHKMWGRVQEGGQLRSKRSAEQPLVCFFEVPVKSTHKHTAAAAQALAPLCHVSASMSRPGHGLEARCIHRLPLVVAPTWPRSVS